MAYVPLHKRHSRERGGPSHVPALSEWRVKKPLNSELPNPIAHQSGRIEYADTAISRGGPSRVPALSEWRVKKPLISRLPNPIAHQSGRIEYADAAISRGGPSHVPALSEWQVKKPLISRLPNSIAHQSGRIEYAGTAISRGGPSRVPALSEWQVKKALISRLPNPIAHQSGKIEYADTALSRWLAVGLDDDGDHLPSSGFLKTVSVEAIEWLPGEKQLALAKSCVANEDDEKKPWVHIVETVVQDLVRSFEVLRSQIKDQSMGETKPTVVARIGKILFRRSPSFPVGTCGDMVTEASLRQLKRSFYTNLPSFYVENVTHKVIPEIGLSFKDEKDIYHVKLCDKSMPGVTICCKCKVIKAEQRLELYKVELGQIRQMVVDVSCINKDLDVRLMLRAKRLFAAISENEKNSISDLITSAVLDSTVKGGLRWPLRKAFSKDRYRVIGAWHTVSTSYNNSSMRLKVKHADRFDFRRSQGQVTEEVTLKLSGITSELHGHSLGTDSVSDMLKDAVKMMWEHFLSCGNTVI